MFQWVQWRPSQDLRRVWTQQFVIQLNLFDWGSYMPSSSQIWMWIQRQHSLNSKTKCCWILIEHLYRKNVFFFYGKCHHTPTSPLSDHLGFTSVCQSSQWSYLGCQSLNCTFEVQKDMTVLLLVLSPSWLMFSWSSYQWSLVLWKVGFLLTHQIEMLNARWVIQAGGASKS